MDFHPLGQTKTRKFYDTDFKVLTSETIDQLQNDEITQISTLCGLSRDYSLLLLRKYSWNKEKLLEKYMENPELSLQQAGISEGVVKNVESEFICEICCTDVTGSNTFSLRCGHEFCMDCYSHYATQKIKDGELTIQCPGVKCSFVIDTGILQQLISEEVFQFHQKMLKRSFVDESKNIKWCPGRNCENAVKCLKGNDLVHVIPTVKCDCGHLFCFGCLLSNHQPCVCSLVKLWMKKCMDDSETSNWISANTQECTRCSAIIEKDGGCNHMSCKNCKYEFCWVCMGPWAEHGSSWYNCNRWNEKSSVSARNVQAKSRAQLERYLHYFNRYANHEQSAKLANDFYLRTEKKMEEMQKKSDFSWIEVQFMKKALDIVLECRNTLKWTYSFAYYLERNNPTELFEDNQRDLEMAVENLNELIEKPIPVID